MLYISTCDGLRRYGWITILLVWDIRFRRNRDTVLGDWKKRWWNWGGPRASICRWISPVVNTPFMRCFGEVYYERPLNNSLWSCQSWGGPRFRQKSKYSGGKFLLFLLNVVDWYVKFPCWPVRGWHFLWPYFTDCPVVVWSMLSSFLFGLWSNVPQKVLSRRSEPHFLFWSSCVSSRMCPLIFSRVHYVTGGWGPSKVLVWSYATFLVGCIEVCTPTCVLWPGTVLLVTDEVASAHCRSAFGDICVCSLCCLRLSSRGELHFPLFSFF